MNLVGLFVWKDVVELGYLPLECFHSVYSIVDRAIISVDPNSGADTLRLVNALCDKYPNVTKVETNWTMDSSNGEVIGYAYNDALSHVSIGDWVLEVKADEILSPALTERIGQSWKLWAQDYNIVSFYFLHTLYNAQLIQPDAGYDTSRKLGLQDGTLRFVTDAWKFDVEQPHKLECSFSKDNPVLHLHHFFRDHFIDQMRGSFRMFSEGWTPDRQAEELKRLNKIRQEPYWDETTSPFANMLSDDVKDHLGKSHYTINWSTL